MFYTYAHYRPDNSVFYIGKGHGRRAWVKQGRNPSWCNIVAKHGDFKVEVLARWATEEEALEHEKFLIWCFRDMGISTANFTDGGEGVVGYKHTEETKQHLKKLNNERVLTDEQIAKIRAGRIGRKHTDQTKKQISQSSVGKVISPEQRQKLSLINTGKKQSPELVRKRIAARLATLAARKKDTERN